MPIRRAAVNARFNGSDGQRDASDGGFSLVELLVTLSVLAILVGLSFPSFSALARDARVTAASSSLRAALFLTRSEAIKRGSRSTICTSRDQATCEQSIGWHHGWIVFIDRNGNARREVEEEIVSFGGAQPAGLRITGNSSVRDYVSYASTGMTRLVGGGLQLGTITLCESNLGRQIVINSTGRPRSVRDVSC